MNAVSLCFLASLLHYSLVVGKRKKEKSPKSLKALPARLCFVGMKKPPLLKRTPLRPKHGTGWARSQSETWRRNRQKLFKSNEITWREAWKKKTVASNGCNRSVLMGSWLVSLVFFSALFAELSSTWLSKIFVAAEKKSAASQINELAARDGEKNKTQRLRGH